MVMATIDWQGWGMIGVYVIVGWLVLSVIFVWWWAKWGANWYFGPRDPFDPEELDEEAEYLRQWSVKRWFKQNQKRRGEDD